MNAPQNTAFWKFTYTKVGKVRAIWLRQFPSEPCAQKFAEQVEAFEFGIKAEIEVNEVTCELATPEDIGIYMRWSDG